MATQIEIINSALAKIRGNLITSINDNKPEARLSKVLFPAIRDRLLREIAPNFARKWYALGQLVETPVDTCYTYAFAVPSDVLRIIETDQGDYDKWVNESGKIYANGTSFKIRAVVKITDAERFDPVFAEVLAYSRAAELALPLTGGSSIAAAMKKEAETLMRSARSYGSQERGAVEAVHASEWLTSRY